MKSVCCPFTLRSVLSAALAAVTLALAACGGGDGGSTAVAAGTSSTAALIATAPEPLGANCPAGGTRVQAGADANLDGVL